MPAMTAATLIENLYGIHTTETENPVTNSVGVAAVKIARNNPNRVVFTIFNLSANNIFIGLTPSVSSTNGMFVAPNGGSIVLQYDKDFMMVTRDIYAISAGAASSIYVLENEIYGRE